MSVSDSQQVHSSRGIGRESLNLPNLITSTRLLMAFVLFSLISVQGWWITSALLFVLAASTDALDGYLARRFGQITVLGRILDPFVDKVIVCGTFVFLLERHGDPDSGVNAWMVIIIISSLRGLLEKEGKDFSASLSGKIKMVLQSVAVTGSLLSLSDQLRTDSFVVARDIVLWSAIGVTVWSGLIYVYRAMQLLREPAG
ncbi:MAG: CDP-alcohol phosphatidyltransferase family protein [Planctomycetaceae bacterium]|nr:CDP-alcohol phosphatidyltransferase family protein [Planctomycetaceae bacterium]